MRKKITSFKCKNWQRVSVREAFTPVIVLQCVLLFKLYPYRAAASAVAADWVSLEYIVMLGNGEGINFQEL